MGVTYRITGWATQENGDAFPGHAARPHRARRTPRPAPKAALSAGRDCPALAGRRRHRAGGPDGPRLAPAPRPGPGAAGVGRADGGERAGQGAHDPPAPSPCPAGPGRQRPRAASACRPATARSVTSTPRSPTGTAGSTARTPAATAPVSVGNGSSPGEPTRITSGDLIHLGTQGTVVIIRLRELAPSPGLLNYLRRIVRTLRPDFDVPRAGSGRAGLEAPTATARRPTSLRKRGRCTSPTWSLMPTGPIRRPRRAWTPARSSPSFPYPANIAAPRCPDAIGARIRRMKRKSPSTGHPAGER